MQRRDFLTTATCSSLALVFNSSAGIQAARATGEPKKRPIAIFTKVFQQHRFDQLAQLLNEVGADGAEAALRAGGYIAPSAQDFEAQVQRLVQTFSKQGQKVLIAATDINELTADTERQLKVFRDHGITHYRLRYWNYNKQQAPLAQLDRFAGHAQRLAEFNEQHGLVGLCQNHAGADICGNLVWDLAVVLKDVDPKQIGVALDLRHLRAEIRGAFGNAIEAVRDKLVSVFVKDTSVVGDDPRQDRLKEVPLGTGLVNQGLFRSVIKSVPEGPLSLHVEYFGQQPIAPEKSQRVVDAYRQDLQTLRQWLAV